MLESLRHHIPSLPLTEGFSLPQPVSTCCKKCATDKDHVPKSCRHQQALPSCVHLHIIQIKLKKPPPMCALKVLCPGGCPDEAYCSAACAAADWHTQHRKLCLGPGITSPSSASGPIGASAPAAAERAAAGSTSQEGTEADEPVEALSAGCSHAQHDGMPQAEPAAPQTHRERLAAFREHADSTNNIFHVIAKLLVSVVCQADALLSQTGESFSRQRLELLL